MTLLLPALLALSPSIATTEELPIEAWIDRLARAETVSMEFLLTSAGGSEARMRFAYEAPDRCALWTDIEGEPTLRVWLEDGVATWYSPGEGGDWSTAHFDWAELTEQSGVWLEELQGAFPAEHPGERLEAGPHLDVWPDLEGDRVEFTLGYTGRVRTLFAWLSRLEEAPVGISREGEDWVCALDGEARLQLEPELGVPRAIWMGDEEEPRQALRLVSLEIDGEGAEDILTVAEAPEGAVDRTEQFVATFTEQNWRTVRVMAYAWLERRVGEGLDLDDEAEELREVLRELHDGWSGEGLRRLRDAELTNLDVWLDRVHEWHEANRDAEGIEAKLAEVLTQGRSGGLQRLGSTMERYTVRLEAPTGGDHDEGVLEAVLELELEAVGAWLEEELMAPVREHIDERLVEFGVDLPE